jgi:homoserine dehydrogenase
MVKIAILGFGVVGGGIAGITEGARERIRSLVGDEIEVKYILDKRDFPDSPFGDRVVRDMSIIAEDPEISVVAEAMGGVNAAYEFTMQAIRGGKSVVTSNKELVAKRGVEIMAEARRMGVQYLFEASVGGGIPEIRSMRTSLAGDKIYAVDGILNGTTNYILTRMKDDGASFEDALKEAQRLGYAEANPTADVDGLDAQRKIMILTAVVTGIMADEKYVYTETMTKITPADMDAAARWGGTVKLVGSSRIDDDGASLYVCPAFVPDSDPLSHIDDVFNGIRVRCEMTGDVMYYGRGAGRYPTAAAMVSDIIAVASGAAAHEKKMDWEKASESFVSPFEENEFRYYVRVSAPSAAEAVEEGRLLFGDVTVIDGAPAGAAEYITAPVKEKAARDLFSSMKGLESRIRLL